MAESADNSLFFSLHLPPRVIFRLEMLYWLGTTRALGTPLRRYTAWQIARNARTNMLMKRPLQLVQLDLPQSVNLLGVMTRSQNSYFAKYLSFLSSSVVLRECVVCVECSLSCKIRHLSHDLAVCRDFFFFCLRVFYSRRIRG